ncbi:hypothetical protein [Helicobacter equorum]|uniref:hypothetical protein n=1 Tax=Helicobacter equorum TaxID=361872 RepID=UPI000CF0E030|nr:hypothetical protein [Helicobacter equorum]
MKIVKYWLSWIILGIIFIPIVLKLAGVIERNLGIQIVPFAWIGLYWFVFFVMMSIKALKDSKKKLVYAYVSVLPLCLSIGEMWGYIKTLQSLPTQCHIQSSGTYISDYFTSDHITGYKAISDTRATSIKTNDKDLIYNVTYTTNDFGYRKTPNSNLDSTHCLIFFGDSFTIGEGLNDDQTLPYFLNQDLNFKVFNFGFHGYGNHQALALLKNGEVMRITRDCKDYTIFYESIPGHIRRANGFSDWEDLNAPRFQLGNTLTWTNEHKTFWTKIHNKIFTILKNKSYLFKILLPRYTYNKQYNELYFAILQEMNSLLQMQFHTELHLLLWDANNLSDDTEIAESQAIVEWLTHQDIDTFLVSEILPQYTHNRLQYALHACDTHPNALANERIAKFLAHKIQSGEITTRQAHTKEIQ